MKGFIWLPILIIIVTALLGGLYFVYNPFNLGNTVNDSKLVSSDIVEELVEVEVAKEGFVPATIKIKKGTQITWTNKDALSHQVASGPHPNHTNLPDFDSLEALKENESYSFIFETSGTFTYHDHLNPANFRGTVVVE